MPQLRSELDLGSTSESEEMYLITIAMAVEDGQVGPVPVPMLAEELGVSRVSANEMIKKLASRDLVEYVPYKGANLRPDGEAIARRILRQRRLWSVFLAEQLGLSPQTADSVACEFEHVTPAEVAQRLAEFLGNPTVGPQGKPIPSADGPSADEDESVALPLAAVGVAHEVLRVDGDDADRAFLKDHAVKPGVTVTVLASADGGGVLVATSDERISLSEPIASLVQVVPSQ